MIAFARLTGADVPDYASLDGAEVTNEFDERLGKITGLFIDDASSTPTWVAVRSGLFGQHHALIPLAQARFDDGRLLVPYTRDDLAIAPHSDPDVPMDAAAEKQLFEHYNVGYSDADLPGPHTGVDAADTGLTGTSEAGSHPVDFDDDSVRADVEAGVPGLPTVDAPAPRLRRY